MTLIVTDLLKRFIDDQATLGGPFDMPDAFFDAMRDFLNNEDARRAVGHAWLKHKVEEGLKSGPGIPADEASAQLKAHAEQMLDVRMREETRGIDNDAQAIELIRQHIRDVEAAVGGLRFETFSEISYMHRVVERALQVVTSALRVLPPSLTDAFSQPDLARLQVLAERAPIIGEPLSSEELWEVARGLFLRFATAFHRLGV